MVEKKSKSLVKLILNPLEVSNEIPCYSLETKEFFYSVSNVFSVNVHDIPVKILHEINSFVLNLDFYFEDDLFVLSNALSANRYLSPLYDNFLKGWQLLEVLKKHSEIYLLIDRSNEIDLWKNFLLSNNINVSLCSKKLLNRQIKSTVSEIFEIFKEYFWVKVIKKNKQIFSRFIFVHWVNQKNMSSNQIINQSSYFGEFLKTFNQIKQVSVLGHISSCNSDFKDIIKSNFNFIKEYISFSDIFWSLFKHTKLLWPIKNKILFGNLDFTSIVKFSLNRDFWCCSYLKNLLLYRCFKKICTNLYHGYTIFYSFENQPWEKALIIAAHQQKHKINLFAYQFFPIPENFLIHCFSEKVKRLGIIPTKILTSDTKSNALLEKHGIETIQLGSLRYNHLLNRQHKVEGNKKILCSLFLDEVEAIGLVKKIIEVAKYIECDFIINYHPLLSGNVLNKIKTMINGSKNIFLSQHTIVDLLDDVFLLIYNSSSVYLEAALRGIAVLYLFCDDIIDLDRFYGLGKVIKDQDNAIYFIQRLMNDEAFYHDYSSKVYKEANQMIIPYNTEIAKKFAS